MADLSTRQGLAHAARVLELEAAQKLAAVPLSSDNEAFVFTRVKLAHLTQKKRFDTLSPVQQLQKCTPPHVSRELSVG